MKRNGAAFGDPNGPLRNPLDSAARLTHFHKEAHPRSHEPTFSGGLDRALLGSSGIFKLRLKAGTTGSNRLK